MYSRERPDEPVCTIARVGVNPSSRTALRNSTAFVSLMIFPSSSNIKSINIFVAVARSEEKRLFLFTHSLGNKSLVQAIVSQNIYIDRNANAETSLCNFLLF